MPLDLPSGDNIAALADWAEVHLSVAPSPHLTAATIDRLLRGEGSDAAAEELEADWEVDEADEILDDAAGREVDILDEGEAERDMRVEQLFAEIELRLGIGSRIYPFGIQDEQIVAHAAPGEVVYMLLLVLSSAEASFRFEKRAHEVEIVYDRIALEALRRFLGYKAQGVRFARNSHDPSDENTRPALFSEAIHWLRDLLDLRPAHRDPAKDDEEPAAHWEFAEEPAMGGRPLLNTYKDGGVDAVVWRPFADQRRGFPVLLAQCTVQLSWENKTSDVKVKMWEKWIDFDTVPPQTALVIPFAINRDDPKWDDRTVSAGVIIDRLRLLELLDELSDAALGDLIDADTEEWVLTELSSLG